ncbi:hypothetical protein AALP_AA1G020700 [Arabis alpina]|uniref:Transmembrane protein n=1 Tax=Arabis alpina TaxID=50452 RepID=A0A087HKI2_ARAAL|nr:hypothetical protein AALP_AA1G020700 [Arabis alpina]
MSILVLFFFIFSTSFLFVSGQNLSAYEVLQKNNLPRGILPHGVTKYDLNQKTGYFKVFFNSTCSFPIDSYKVKYQSKISGYLRTGRVRQLQGVSVKVLFFWVHIEEVYRDDDDIDFSVGVASEEFSVRNFERSPQCGCGFDCYRPVSSI